MIKHEKDGREHLHVVWQRTDIDTEKLRADNWNYAAHERAARQLEKEFGHDHVQGKHVGKEKFRAKLRSEVDKTMSYAEFQQAQRAGKDAKQIKELVTNLFHQSKNGVDFQKALVDEGYILAKGNRRSLVLVDSAGKVYSLSRYTKGVKKDERDAKLGDLDQEKLFSVDQAKEKQKQRWQEERQKPQSVKILVDENQIANSPELQKINQKYNHDMEQLIQYQKDERQYQEGIWADKIDHKTKAFKQEMEIRQKREFRANGGINADNRAGDRAGNRAGNQEGRKEGILINVLKTAYSRIHDLWMKWGGIRKDDVNPDIKKDRQYRNERDAEELIAFVDDLHRVRDDDAQNFEREQARERLSLESRRQDDLVQALAQALKKEQENQERLQKAREEQQKQQSRDRDDPRDRDR